jgi:uncharacterized protein
MEVGQHESGSKGIFYLGDDNNHLGEMIYTRSTDTITIHHTEVSEQLRGKSAGKQLVAAGVEFARKNNLKIIPHCRFAKTIFEKVTEFQDVLKK